MVLNHEISQDYTEKFVSFVLDRSKAVAKARGDPTKHWKIFIRLPGINYRFIFVKNIINNIVYTVRNFAQRFTKTW